MSLPLSIALFPHAVVVGPGFYNGVLGPTVVLLLVAMAAAPLLRRARRPKHGNAARCGRRSPRA